MTTSVFVEWAQEGSWAAGFCGRIKDRKSREQKPSVGKDRKPPTRAREGFFPTHTSCLCGVDRVVSRPLHFPPTRSIQPPIDRPSFDPTQIKATRLLPNRWRVPSIHTVRRSLPRSISIVVAKRPDRWRLFYCWLPPSFPSTRSIDPSDRSKPSLLPKLTGQPQCPALPSFELTHCIPTQTQPRRQAAKASYG